MQAASRAVGASADSDAADAPGRPQEGTSQGPSLSPSRAGDFRSCPMRFRLRVVDRLPERPSPDAARGTLVHSILERLFDLSAAERTLAAAAGMVEQEYRRLLDSDPDFADLVSEADGAGSGWSSQWLASVPPLLEGYFELEDPRRIEPAQREQLVQVELETGLTLRGFVDRLDVAPTGEVRVVDYKTGRSPSDRYTGQAMFQLRFYALVLWRSTGVVPRQLRLMYLRDRDMLTYSPTEDELERFERTIRSLWAAIERALATGDFRPQKGPLCGYCDFKPLCPAWDGTPPPYPGADAPSPEPRASEEPS